jgi:uncharacterized membrane protein YkoI
MKFPTQKALLVPATAVVLAAAAFGWVLQQVQAHEKNAQEIEISALSPEEKLKWVKAVKVPLTDAIKTALARTPGQAVQATLESLKGRLLYEIEIVTAEGVVVEVFIDPQSGKIIDAGGTQ